MGDWSAAWFSRVETEAAPSASNVPSASVPPWDRVQPWLQQVKTKVSVQSFCFMLKLNFLEPTVSC